MPTRIFLIEDHQMLRDGIKLLVERGAELQLVAEAGTLAEATQNLGKAGVDVVLMDFKLPDGDSLSLVPRIRRVHPEAKVLVLSGSITRPLVRACLLAGANGFIAKEDGGQEIIRGIKTVMAGETFLSTRAVSIVADGLRTGEAPSIAGLSGQELSVLRGIASGLTYKEIAQQLGIGIKSVETYRARLVRKTGLKSKVALAKFAAANEIVGG